MTATAKLRFATVWLAGCSGCHMSFLDLDEWLFKLAERVEVVFSPVASDVKVFPEGVDVCLVEGAVEACTSCGKCVDVCPTGALFRKEDSTAEKQPHPDRARRLRRAREQQEWEIP